MFFKIFLTIAIFLCFYGATAAKIDCTSLNTAACRKLFAEKIDEEIMFLHTTVLTTHMSKMTEIFTKMLPDMTEDDNCKKNVKTSIETMKAAMETIDRLKNNQMNSNEFNAENVRLMISHSFGGMSAELGKYCTESAEEQKRFDDLMQKHGYKKELIEDVALKMMTEFEQFWAALYADLRTEDKNEFKEYNEINEMVKTATTVGEVKPKARLLIMTLTKIKTFYATPYIEGMLGAVHADA